VAPAVFARGKYAARSDIGHSSDPSPCELEGCRVDCRDDLMYHNFIHDVSKNVAPLNRLLKGVVFFPFGPSITSYQSFLC
jgi:hypothetical protein